MKTKTTFMKRASIGYSKTKTKELRGYEYGIQKTYC